MKKILLHKYRSVGYLLQSYIFLIQQIFQYKLGKKIGINPQKEEPIVMKVLQHILKGGVVKPEPEPQLFALAGPKPESISVPEPDSDPD